MESPTKIHLLAAKRNFRYFQGTKDFGLFYKKDEKSGLIGFSDCDYPRDQDDRKSTSGYFCARHVGCFMVFQEAKNCHFIDY